MRPWSGAILLVERLKQGSEDRKQGRERERNPNQRHAQLCPVNQGKGTAVAHVSLTLTH